MKALSIVFNILDLIVCVILFFVLSISISSWSADPVICFFYFYIALSAITSIITIPFLCKEITSLPIGVLNTLFCFLLPGLFYLCWCDKVPQDYIKKAALIFNIICLVVLFILTTIYFKDIKQQPYCWPILIIVVCAIMCVIAMVSLIKGTPSIAIGVMSLLLCGGLLYLIWLDQELGYVLSVRRNDVVEKTTIMPNTDLPKEPQISTETVTNTDLPEVRKLSVGSIVINTKEVITSKKVIPINTKGVVESLSSVSKDICVISFENPDGSKTRAYVRKEFLKAI